jgi:diguanylate cyclase (GGDEF)-like protein
MKIPKKVIQVINRLSIGSKLNLSFGLFLSIILMEVGVSIIAMNLIWESTSSIKLNAEIERIVLNMSRNWESAQRLEKLFFFQSQTTPGDQAYKLYALPASTKIDEIIRDGAKLKQINRSNGTRSLLLEKDEELDKVLSEISQYASTLQEATDLELQLSSSDTGLRKDMELKALALLRSLQSNRQNADTISAYYKIRYYDEDYIIFHRKTSSAASALNIEILHQEISEHFTQEYSRTQAYLALDDYEKARNTIILTDAAIQIKLNSLESLGQSMEPKMIDLMTAINSDMVKNRLLIEQTRYVTGLAMIIVVLAALLVTVVIALMLDKSITRKVVRLNQVANQLQNGNLDARAQVDSTDELGQLASSFNNMAYRLRQTIVDTRHQAEHDHLTGLYNRMGFWESSQREINRCLRYNHPVSLLFLDIDEFKKFNDHYSYEVGDKVLKHLTKCLVDDLRNIDLIGRYGGEEFVILLPETDLTGASEVAERLRAYIESRALKTDFGPVSITVSIGIGKYHPDFLNKPDLTDEQILNRLIDQGGDMLHVAKAEGRNRVAVPDV